MKESRLCCILDTLAVCTHCKIPYCKPCANVLKRPDTTDDDGYIVCSCGAKGYERWEVNNLFRIPEKR